MEVVALVSCVKSKQATAAPAQDLYISTLFRLSRRYVEAVADRWFILSAEHGLLEPQQRVEPYERTLLRMKKVERDQWAAAVVRSIEVRVPSGARLVSLAGRSYVVGWREMLEGRYSIEEPLRGLGLGRRIQWLDNQIRELSAASVAHK